MIAKHDLTTTELLLLQSELRSSEKSLGLAYLMLLGGHLGLHRFYLKRKASAIIQFIVFILCVVLYLIMYGFILSDSELGTIWSTIFFGLLVLTLTVWVIVDACLIPGIVRRLNERIEQELVEQIVDYRRHARSRSSASSIEQ